jgi:hypothetical protein
MTVQYLNIDEKHRQGLGNVASILDFSVSEGEAVDAGIVLSSPNLSLYCMDDANRRAIFVELPDGIDLTTAPFVYVTQYEQAQRLLAVPYESFRRAAKTLPETERLILIYISGRSGSTLLSSLFNELDSVASLAEPDVATQFVKLRPADGSRDAELRDLFDCTVRILFKPTPFKAADTFALKFRSEGLQIMDLCHAALPQAKNLFLYRDAIGFTASFYRIFTKNDEFPESMTRSDWVAAFTDMMNYDFAPAAATLAPGLELLSMPQHLCMWWAVIMDWYLAQYAGGIPVLAVHYADLNAHKEQVVRAIFEYCGLPTAQLAQSLRAFERDSQAGTLLAREKPTEGNKPKFTAEQTAEITRILARHPVIRDSDFIAPGTLRL